MLQKLFRRARESFRRSKHKNAVKNGLSETNEQHSVDVNESSVPVDMVSTSSESTSKKVTFKECSENSVELTDEQSGQVLFDNNVLEAIQDGQLSIADFLENPNVDKIQKVRSMSDSDVVSSDHPNSSLTSRTRKKLSLLDRAHSMASRHNTRKIPASVLRQEPVDDNFEHVKSEPSKTWAGNRDSTELDPSSAASVVKKSSPRFSKSLEDLAQEVFGEQFQSYLESASKSPVKISVSKNEVVEKQLPKKRPVLVPQLQLSLSSEFSFDETTYPSSKLSKSLSPRYVTTYEHGNHLKIEKNDPITRKQHQNNSRNSLVRTQSSPRNRGSRLQRLVKDQPIVKSVDIPVLLNGQEKIEKSLESWNNKLDLRRGGSLTTIEGEMLAIVEEKHAVDDTCEYVNVPSTSCTESTFNAVYQNVDKHSSLCQRKIFKSDSQFVNTGSYNDIQVLGTDESTVMDFQFPPPPAIDSTDIQFDESEWDTALDETPYSSREGVFFRANSDPLIDSLMTIIPLPEDHQSLLPALTKAFSEIISEIIASRRKLSRILKAISIHQEILKEQSKQIQLQALEISGLRKISNSTNLSGGKRSQSERTNRQSREMVELNLTLDKLLHQCTELKSTPRNSGGEISASPRITSAHHMSCDGGKNVGDINNDPQYFNFRVETNGNRECSPSSKRRANSLPNGTKHRTNDGVLECLKNIEQLS